MRGSESRCERGREGNVTEARGAGTSGGEAGKSGGDDVVHDVVHDVLHTTDGHAEAEGAAEEAAVGGVAGVFLRFMHEIAQTAEVGE